MLHYDPTEYGEKWVFKPDLNYIISLYTIYPYWNGGPREGANRNAQIQAIYQLLGIFITLLTAFVGGIITGKFYTD